MLPTTTVREREMAERDPAVAGYVDPGGEERARLREDFDFNDANGDGRIDRKSVV